MCPECGKPKMQFETERKANDFIKWNSDEMETGGKSLRVYYCKACCCWHISHRQYRKGYGRTLDNKIKTYEQQKRNSGKKIDRLIRNVTYNTKSNNKHTSYDEE